MAKTLKVGIIGVGGIAQVHMPGWERSPHTEVVVGCDVDEGALKSWSEKYQVPKITTNVNDLLTDKTIDIIDICTPNKYHAPLTIAALEAGKHVLCEKPLAPTPTEIRQMIEARDRSGKLLMTAQQQRFQGNSKALMREIKQGALGDIYHARSWMLRRIAFPGRESFWLKKYSGGGACIDIGVHVLDLTLWFMGNPQPIAVTGVSRTVLAKNQGAFSLWGGFPVPKDADVEEFAAGFVRFANGATLILEVSWLLHHNTPGEDEQIWLYGTNGGAHHPKGEIYQTNYTTRQLYNTSLQITADVNPPHAQECIEFAQAIIDGAPSPVPPEQSLQVLSILDAVYRSQESGREIRLDTD